jgi:hypothetical protein
MVDNLRITTSFSDVVRPCTGGRLLQGIVIASTDQNALLMLEGKLKFAARLKKVGCERVASSLDIS